MRHMAYMPGVDPAHMLFGELQSGICQVAVPKLVPLSHGQLQAGALRRPEDGLDGLDGHLHIRVL